MLNFFFLFFLLLMQWKYEFLCADVGEKRFDFSSSLISCGVVTEE